MEGGADEGASAGAGADEGASVKECPGRCGGAGAGAEFSGTPGIKEPGRATCDCASARAAMVPTEGEGKADVSANRANHCFSFSSLLARSSAMVSFLASSAKDVI